MCEILATLILNGIDFNDSMQRVAHESIGELDAAAKNLDNNFQFTFGH